MGRELAALVCASAVAFMSSFSQAAIPSRNSNTCASLEQAVNGVPAKRPTDSLLSVKVRLVDKAPYKYRINFYVSGIAPQPKNDQDVINFS